MKRRALICLFAFLLAIPSAFAACTNPAGNERKIIYNGDFHATQFCNGAQWTALGIGTGGGGGGCTSPTASERKIIYSSEYSHLTVLQRHKLDQI